MSNETNEAAKKKRPRYSISYAVIVTLSSQTAKQSGVSEGSPYGSTTGQAYEAARSNDPMLQRSLFTKRPLLRFFASATPLKAAANALAQNDDKYPRKDFVSDMFLIRLQLIAYSL